jgi:hypothetical protein
MFYRSAPVGLVFVLLVSLLAGCATSRVETKKDINVFRPGVAREVVIDEVGAPVSTTKSRAGNTVDVFTFVQGTAPSGKPARPVEPEMAEQVELLALMEQGGRSPLSALTGKKLTVQVNYDGDLRVMDTVLLRAE